MAHTANADQEKQDTLARGGDWKCRTAKEARAKARAKARKVTSKRKADSEDEGRGGRGQR